jgi:hypothetical protein
MLNVILNEPDLAEWCFLLAVIIFVIAALLYWKDPPTWRYTPALVPTGLAIFALGFLAL